MRVRALGVTVIALVSLYWVCFYIALAGEAGDWKAQWEMAVQTAKSDRVP